jgi:hypothetical protein
MSKIAGTSYEFFPLRMLLAVFGSFAFAGYYPELVKPYIHAWVAVGIFLLPVFILFFINWGELPDRVVARLHLLAAIWFLLLSAGMEIGVLSGHRPPGTNLYRVLAHLAWTFSWAAVLKTAYRRRR